MRAIYDYSGSQDDDLCFKEGDLVRVMYEGKDGWAEGLMGEKYGYVPISYLEPVWGSSHKKTDEILNIVCWSVVAIAVPSLGQV